MSKCRSCRVSLHPAVDDMDKLLCSTCMSNKPKTRSSTSQASHRTRKQHINKRGTKRAKPNERFTSDAAEDTSSDEGSVMSRDSNSVRSKKSITADLKSYFSEHNRKGTTATMEGALLAFAQSLDDKMDESDSYCAKKFEKIDYNIKKLRESDSSKNKQIERMQKDIDEVKQYRNSYRNELIISGIRGPKDARVNDQLLTIFTHLGVPVTQVDIAKIRKIKLHELPNMLPVHTVMVRLRSELTWATLIKAKREKGSVKAKSVFPDETDAELYINLGEALPRTTNDLYKKVQAEAKQCNYKFAWHTDGQIFVRKKQEDPAVHIRSNEDLAKLKSNVD